MVVGTKTLDVFVNVNFLLLWTPCSFSNISFFFFKKEKIKLSPLLFAKFNLHFFLILLCYQRLHKCLRAVGFNVIEIVSADVGNLCKVILIIG